jgi:hypothetical protein
VPLGLWLGLTLPLREMEPVLEALAPAVREPVGEADCVLLPLRVEEGVPVPVLELVALPVPVLLALAPGVTGGVLLGVRGPEAEGLRVALLDRVAELDSVALPVALLDSVALPLALLHSVALSVALLD